MRRGLLLAAGLMVLGGIVISGGCGGATVPVLQDKNSSDLGVLDSGTGKCGTAACAHGQLCCASADESCAPTCMNVDRCPVYGRPCSAGDAATSNLHWYWTCGDPICQEEDGGAPVPVCPDAGTSCMTKGETCGKRDPGFHCGAIRVCEDHDPTTLGCPISTRKAKDEIAYVDPGELQRLHDETLAMRLATYRYKGPFADPADPNARHLGFIIEDQPQSLSVERGHDRVDMYGYLSMAVATMQVQEREIAELKRDIQDLRQSCMAPKKH